MRFRPSNIPGRKGTLYYRIAYQKSYRQVNSQIRLSETEWKILSGQMKRKQVESPASRRIHEEMKLLQLIAGHFERFCPYHTFRDLAGCFQHAKGKTGLLAFLDEQIASLQAAERHGTARNYQRTRNSIATFLRQKEIPFACLSPAVISKYEEWLTQKGVVRNSRSFYMRNLRSAYNKAVTQNQAPPNQQLFAATYTGIGKTRKRAIDEQTVCRLYRLDLKNAQAFARDLFIFSYCTRGMAFVDMAFLKRQNVKQGQIRYQRHKTGQQLVIRIEPVVQEIIRRYQNPPNPAGYIFPIIHSENPAEAYKQYLSALGYYNRLLKQLSERLGCTAGLSSYTARHTWATAARDRNIPLAVISAGMGHNSENTTRIYLASLENEVIDQANSGIIAALEKTE